MKPAPLFRCLIATLIVVAFAGCATSPRGTERDLAASGFQVVPATTPEQLRQLNTLPNERISVINRQGEVYFVYPDRAKNQLYVGRNAQYSAYQNLLLNQKAQTEALQTERDATNAEIINTEATALSDDPWAAFGVWPLAPF